MIASSCGGGGGGGSTSPSGSSTSGGTASSEGTSTSGGSSTSGSSSTTSGGSTSSGGSADSSPPAINYWNYAASSDSSITGTANISEAGTGYCAAVEANSAAPSVDQIIAGYGGGIVGSAGVVSLTTGVDGQCTVSGLQPNSLYLVYFTAVDAVGNRQTSTLLFNASTTTSNANSAPPAPANVNAIDAGNGYIGVVWETVPGATHYVIYAQTSASAPYAAAVINDPSVSTWLLGPVTLWENYGITVTAFNSYGESPPSAASWIRPIGPHNPPTGAAGYGGPGAGELTAVWYATQGTLQYELGCVHGVDPAITTITTSPSGILGGLVSGISYTCYVRSLYVDNVWSGDNVFYIGAVP